MCCSGLGRERKHPDKPHSVRRRQVSCSRLSLHGLHVYLIRSLVGFKQHKILKSKKGEDQRGRDGEGNGTPLQYSCLENPMDGGAWWATVHGVAKSRTRLSDFTFTFHFHALEKEMATHSSVLAWIIPGTGGAWWAAVSGVAELDTTEATS